MFFEDFYLQTNNDYFQSNALVKRYIDLLLRLWNRACAPMRFALTYDNGKVAKVFSAGSKKYMFFVNIYGAE